MQEKDKETMAVHNMILRVICQNSSGGEFKGERLAQAGRQECIGDVLEGRKPDRSKKWRK